MKAITSLIPAGKLVNHCSRFDYTCCNKGLEDKLAEEASRNFKQDLDYVVTAQRAYCTKMKTDLLSEFTVQNYITKSTCSAVSMLFIIVVRTVSKCVGQV